MLESTRHSYGVDPPGFRLPEATRVGAVHLLVSDLDRSLDYYQQVLGLAQLERVADGAELGAAGQVLLSLRSGPGVRRGRRGAFGLYHVAVLLPDRPALGRFAAHLLRLGIRFASADHAVSEALYLSDPDGLGIEVYADRPADAWAAAGDEVLMTTQPLEVQDVVAAGSGAAWDGAPAGTSVGHVHLHVGDLGEAERFYHTGLGLRKVVWSYPGALFLAAGSYHHHLGTNVWAPGPAPADDEARLLEWELVVPEARAVGRAAESLAAAGYSPDMPSGDLVVSDPWGTRLRVTSTTTEELVLDRARRRPL